MKAIICLLIASYAFAGVSVTQPIETQQPLPIQQGGKEQTQTQQSTETLLPKQEAPKQEQTQTQQELPKVVETKQETAPKQEQTQTQQELPKVENKQETHTDQASPKQGKAWNDMSIESSECAQGLLLCESTRFDDNTFSDVVDRICYSPLSHFCAKREDGIEPGNLLCPLNAPKLCGYQCYNENQFTCVVHEALCPVSAPLLCGSDCYNKQFFSCANGRLVQLGSSDVDMFAGLSTSLQSCDKMTCVTTIPFTDMEFPRCFDPAENTCAHRQGKLDHSSLLCPITHPAACRGHCYVAGMYVCHVESSLCPAGSAPKLCGEDCFNPSEYRCVDDILVPTGVKPIQAIQQGEKGFGAVLQQDQPVQQQQQQPIEKAVEQKQQPIEKAVEQPVQQQQQQPIEKAVEKPAEPVKEQQPIQQQQQQQQQPIESGKKN